MPRKNLIRSHVFPYHVTARVNNKEPFPISLHSVWEIVLNELLLLNILFKIEVQAFVLMPNHFHLIVTTPEENLGKIMQLLMTNITRLIHSKSGRSGRVFGARYHWSIITSTRYYGHALKYVYRNPVKAALCKQVEEYDFSTLKGSVGMGRAYIPLHYTRVGMEINLPEPEDVSNWLYWLNTPFPQEAEELIRKAIYRYEIKALIHQKTRKPHPLLEMRL